MIKELNEIEELPKDSPLITKYFNGLMNKKENIEMNKMMKKKIEFYRKVFNEKNYHSGFCYLDNYGFYKLKRSNQTKNYFHISYYGEDIDTAFIKIIHDDLSLRAKFYTINNYKKLLISLKSEITNIGFKPSDINGCSQYFQKICTAQYIIDKWDKYYDGNLPENIIKFYEDYLNNNSWNITWSYNKETKKIICEPIAPKKLERTKNEKRY